jgi:hypothetical protein
MKKLILLSVAALCLNVASAQVNHQSSVMEKEKVRFGIKAGAQVSKVTDIHFESIRRMPGLTAGITLQIPFLQEDDGRLYFAPELLYSQKGEKEKPRNESEKNFYHDYLSLPLMLKFYPKHLKSVYVEFGFEPSVMIYMTNKGVDLGEPNKFDLGGCFGAGIHFGQNNNFGLGARLNLGLMDMYPDVKSHNFNMSGSVMLTYLFGK